MLSDSNFIYYMWAHNCTNTITFNSLSLIFNANFTKFTGGLAAQKPITSSFSLSFIFCGCQSLYAHMFIVFSAKSRRVAQSLPMRCTKVTERLPQKGYPWVNLACLFCPWSLVFFSLGINTHFKVQTSWIHVVKVYKEEGWTITVKILLSPCLVLKY